MEAEGEDDGGGVKGTFDYNEKKIKLSGIRFSVEQPTNHVVA